MAETTLQTTLEQALHGNHTADGAYTTRDLEKLTGWGEAKVRRAMRAVIESGIWESVTVTRRSVLTGGTKRVVAYRPKKRRTR